MARKQWNMASAFLSIWVLLLCHGVATAQSDDNTTQQIVASNLTTDLPPAGTTRFIFNSTEAGVPQLDLDPLTDNIAYMSKGTFETFNITGPLVNINPSTTSYLQYTDIAYISCDVADYDGDIGPSHTFYLAVTHRPWPAAVILYSTTSNHCNYTSTGDFVWGLTFTTTNPVVAEMVANRKLTNSSSGSVSSGIYPDPATLPKSGGSNGTANGSSPSPTKTPEFKPTSANVAMIILYAITGIITALFIIIIITGAIRAHRHPERYGPRNIIGRPRQSRAKGVARAMLETLPIVKFGDPDPQHPKPADIELATAPAATAGDQQPEEREVGTSADVADQTMSGAEDIEAHSQHSAQPAVRPDGTDENGSLGCSICTEDFAKGQEVRVLPCNHKFHPDCVDPWLLNVSGTCPLCRTNLDPSATTAAENFTELPPDPSSSPSSSLPPPVSFTVAGNSGLAHDAALNAFTARRMSQISAQDRLQAIRRLNEEGGMANRSDRPRLSERLREKLKIRTRRQGEDGTAAELAPGAARDSSNAAPATTSAAPEISGT